MIHAFLMYLTIEILSLIVILTVEMPSHYYIIWGLLLFLSAMMAVITLNYKRWFNGSS